MPNITKILADLANTLDKSNLTKTADAIDAINSNVLKITKAQYEGVQGYWIRNGRCWQNCYRQKRAKTDLAAQEVWNECHKEYLESFRKDKSDWDKYADEIPNLKKVANASIAKIVSAEEKRFHDGIKKSMNNGMDRPTAIFATINSNKERLSRYLIAQAQQVAKVATDLDYAGHKELAEKTASVSAELAKCAQTEFSAPPTGANTPGKTGLLRGIGRGVRGLTGWFGGELRNLQNQIFNINKYIDHYGQNLGSNPVRLQELQQALVRESSNLSNIAARSKSPEVKNLAQQAMQSINAFSSSANEQNVLQEMNNLKIDLTGITSGLQQMSQNTEQGEQTPYGQQFGNTAAPSSPQQPAAEQTVPEQTVAPEQAQTAAQNMEALGGFTSIVTEMFKTMPPQDLEKILNYVTEGGEFKRTEGNTSTAQSKIEPSSLKTSNFTIGMEKIAQNMNMQDFIERYRTRIMQHLTTKENKQKLANFINNTFKAQGRPALLAPAGAVPVGTAAPDTTPAPANQFTTSVPSVGPQQSVTSVPSVESQQSVTSVPDAGTQPFSTSIPGEVSQEELYDEFGGTKALMNSAREKPSNKKMNDLIKNIFPIINADQKASIDSLVKDFTKTHKTPKTDEAIRDYNVILDELNQSFAQAQVAKAKAADIRPRILKKAMSPSAKKVLNRLLKGF
jgi:hypothetical protein